jgi:adenylyl- and sulfurtransferase ThiI
MFVSYAETVEQFREEVVTLLRHDAERRASQKLHARTKAERLVEAAREQELRNQATFFEGIKFFHRAERAEMETINFDAAKAERFRKRYESAVRDGEEMFKFEGKDFLVGYAKYVLEYLEGKFK